MKRPDIKIPDMPEINFERLLSRDISRFFSRELDLAGMKMTVNRLLTFMLVPAVILFILGTFLMSVVYNFNILVSFLIGLAFAGLNIGLVYLYLEYKIDQRRTALESMLPDFLQIAAANLRSGISLERAFLLAARPEFGFLSEDIKEMNRRVFGGQTLEASLTEFSNRYRSYQLQHATRMVLEALRFGGAMSDLLGQISKDMRNQQMIQKEVAGQLLMYTIFVAFAGIVAAPVLYGLTSQMIVVTDSVWNGILQSNPNGLPSTGISFLKPSPPKITPQAYSTFSYIAIIIITAFATLIMSAISSGSAVRGLRYMPVAVIFGLLVYFVVKTVIGSLFGSIGSG